ncbi:hypothetical protein K469DRAFT_683415 [Zopfia rhizophila CBS 207.26]|uniref:Uncharacterized protein n=1 Tax=Zopfia rhizophila CBS 207.26 TaxID=1314779 RepID=A0A6A6DC59_9PEZI|nr:hypothetical protein K469DRAFT_683415 [Zopfia rhizophila CBS 207.26]
MPLPLLETLEGQVDQTKWGQRIEPSDPNNTKLGIDTHILYFQNSYIHHGDYDYDLFEAIVEDFRGWKEETFKLVDTDVNRRFRDFLRQNGIPVLTGKGPIARALADIVAKDEMPPWPPEEL